MKNFSKNNDGFAFLEEELHFEFIEGGVTPVAASESRPHRILPFHALIVLGDGLVSRFQAENEIHLMKSDEAYFLPAGLPHSLTPIQGGTSVWCHFRARILHQLDFLQFFRIPFCFPADRMPVLRQSLCRYLDSLRGRSSPVEILENRMAGLAVIAEIIRGAPFSEPEQKELLQLRQLSPALRLMQRRIADRPVIGELARAVNLSPSRFMVCFKTLFGMAPATYFQQMRIERAHALLSAGYGAAETATMLGFSSVFHFSSRFKCHFGITPAEFLRRHRSSPFSP